MNNIQCCFFCTNNGKIELISAIIADTMCDKIDAALRQKRDSTAIDADVTAPIKRQKTSHKGDINFDCNITPSLNAIIAPPDNQDLVALLRRAVDYCGLVALIVGHNVGDSQYNVVLYDMINRILHLATCPKYEALQLNSLSHLHLPYRVIDVAPNQQFDEYFARIIRNGQEVLNVYCGNDISKVNKIYWLQYRIMNIWTKPRETTINAQSMSEFTTSVCGLYNAYL